MIDPEVRAGWLAFSSPLEGGVEVDCMFRDTAAEGYVTTGGGIMLATPVAACALAWRRADGSFATPVEIRAEWARVHGLPPGRVWSWYRSPTAGLHLDADELARVVLARLDADVEVLEERWPSFASWPAPAQAGTAAIAWGVGPGSTGHGLEGREWPASQANLDRQDWRACATSMQLRWTDNPGARPRDLAVTALFLQAAGASDEESRAGWPAGPAATAAGKALEGLGLDASDTRATLPTGEMKSG